MKSFHPQLISKYSLERLEDRLCRWNWSWYEPPAACGSTLSVHGFSAFLLRICLITCVCSFCSSWLRAETDSVNTIQSCSLWFARWPGWYLTLTSSQVTLNAVLTGDHPSWGGAGPLGPVLFCLFFNSYVLLLNSLCVIRNELSFCWFVIKGHRTQ